MTNERQEALRLNLEGRIKDAEKKIGLYTNTLESLSDKSEVLAVSTVIVMLEESLVRLKLESDRLKRGEYGKCFSCGGEIEESRLIRLFLSLRCQRCQDNWDRQP